MKNIYRLLALSACTVLLGLAVMASAQEETNMPVVTGAHWTTASEDEKHAFLMGIGTMLETEQGFQASNPPAPGTSLTPLMIRGLDKYSITEVLQGLDAWYASNGAQLNRPVIEVIWYEFAAPNLPTN